MQIHLGSLILHWGAPKHDLEFRAWTGTLSYKPKPDEPSEVRHDYISHKVERWYGISYKRAGFLGFSRFGVTTQERTEKLPSYVSREERARWANYDNWLETNDDD